MRSPFSEEYPFNWEEILKPWEELEEFITQIKKELGWIK